MVWRKIIWVSIFVLLARNIVFSSTLTGYILDEHDRTPLSYAVIYWQENSQPFVADSMGMFKIPNMQEGNHILTILHIDCADTSIVINIHVDTTIEFVMEHHTQMLQELVVHAHDIQHSTVIRTIDNLALQQNSGNIGKLMSFIPGASVTQSGPNIYKPMLHGMFGDRILFMYNDIPLRSQDWGTEHAPEMDVSHMQVVEVYTGAPTVKYSVGAYGGALAVHDIDIGNLDDRQYTGKIISESNSLLWGLSQRWQQSRLLKKDNVIKYIIQGSGYMNRDVKAPKYALFNTSSKSASASTYFQYNRNRNNKFLKNTFYYSYYNSANAILRNAHISNIEDLYNAIDNDVPTYSGINDYTLDNPRQHTSHHTLSLSHELHWKASHQVLFSYNFQYDNRKEYDIRRGNRSDIPALAMQLFTHELLGSYQYRNDKVLFQSGVDFLYYINNNKEDLGIKPLVPNYARSSMSQWGLLEYRMLHNQTLQGGYRLQLENYDIFTFDNKNQNITLQNQYLGSAVAFTYKISQTYFSLTQDLHYRRRPPTIAELFSQGLHHGAAAIEYGNSKLKPENVFSLQYTLQIIPAKVWNLSVLPYYYYIHNFIYLQPRPNPIQTIRGAFFAYDYTHANVNIMGIDIVQKISFLDGLISWVSKFSGNRSFISHSREYLPYMPQSCFSNLWNISKVFDKKLYKFSISMNYDYYFRKNTYTQSLEINTPPSGYGLLDMNTELQWKYKSHIFTWIMGLQNILNTTYRSYTDRFRYFSDAAGINFVTTLIYSLHKSKK